LQIKIDGETVFFSSGNRHFDPKKDTVLLIHGTGQDHSIWGLPTRYLARHDRNVIAVDLPGHGRSGGAPMNSILALADWVVKVLDSAGITSTAVVGHSLGSLVAIAVAALYPRRVRSIVLIGTAVPMPVSEHLLEKARENSHEAIEMLTHWGFSKAAQSGGNTEGGSELLNSSMRLMEKAKPGVIYADLVACNGYREGMEHAKNVDCPALLILGECDRLTPVRSAARLAEALPNAEKVIVEGSGHALLAERPDTVLDQLIRMV
jgi:pimeloyl-ACP methyl ester carboxylesterase